VSLPRVLGGNSPCTGGFLLSVDRAVRKAHGARARSPQARRRVRTSFAQIEAKTRGKGLFFNLA
jgi:hypothetical protein